MSTKPPVPPFTRETAIQKVRIAEDAWNGQDPEKVALAYTANSAWRNRDTFIQGRDEIIAFLKDKWAKERNYRLIKELWAFTDDRIAARYCYEFQPSEGQWYRAYGNENWEFESNGLMSHRHASINDVAITEAERKFHWEFATPRPEGHPGLSDLGL